MLNFLAQTYQYDTTSLTAEESAGAAIFGGFFLLIWLAVVVVMVVSLWKIFEKAGVEGWKSIIPIYNYWVVCEIAGKPGWWSLVSLLAWIPVLGYLAVLAVSIIVSLELTKSFGKDPVYALLLILVPMVGYPYLAFGDAKYVGPGGKKSAK